MWHIPCVTQLLKQLKPVAAAAGMQIWGAIQKWDKLGGWTPTIGSWICNWTLIEKE